MEETGGTGREDGGFAPSVPCGQACGRTDMSRAAGWRGGWRE